MKEFILAASFIYIIQLIARGISEDYPKSDIGAWIILFGFLAVGIIGFLNNY